MISRRQFLKLAALAGTGLALAPRRLPTLASTSGQTKLKEQRLRAPIPGGTLDPLTVPKYVTPLVIPPAMPRTSEITGRKGEAIDYYEIAARQFTQHILPAQMGLPETTVWSYASVSAPQTLNYPAFTIEGTVGKPVRVKWVNDLKDPQTGHYLPHLLAVDQTLHWANPPGGEMHRDHQSLDPAPYTGPVPLVTHVHGAHTTEESDGYTEAWFLPTANNIPAMYAKVGSFYEEFKAKAAARFGSIWEPGTATFQYPNDQRATTIWYHDHALGMTRLNVYAGPAGFYLLRGGPDDVPAGVLPGPAPQLGDAPGLRYYEIPLAIQDRSFNADGSLFYPRSREFFDDFDGPYIPESDISPIWNPEFFGNMMLVNGKTWPYLEVEPRRYRFRFLDGCNSRFLILRMQAFDDNMEEKTPPTFWQIGCEGGFLDEPVELTELLMSPAERADCILDFSDFVPGDTIRLINVAPDEPFGGGMPGMDFEPADPDTTGQVMEFRVVPLDSTDTSTPPDELQLPARTPLGAPQKTRKVSLNEVDSEVLEGVGPRAALLGVLTPQNTGVPLLWMDPITETPLLGDTEVWEIYNYTMDAHPIHIHEVMFEVVNREVFTAEHGETPGTVTLPEPGERGYKDTVIAYPGHITRIKAKFDLPGLYVWHCHIVEHEDNEMMRPYRVLYQYQLPLLGR